MLLLFKSDAHDSEISNTLTSDTNSILHSQVESGEEDRLPRKESLTGITLFLSSCLFTSFTVDFCYPQPSGTFSGPF